MDGIINVLQSDKKVLVITGAGISTLSGIPDFRGKNGIYQKEYDATEILKRGCMLYKPETFYDFYTRNMLIGGYEPNMIHEILAKLEKNGNIIGIITQNIDNLHQKAGSENVVALHGNGERFYCESCLKEYTQEHYKTKGCMCKCGGVIRPDIVLYGERYNVEEYKKCISMLEEADALIVLGSSLTAIQEIIFRYLLLDFNKELYIVNNQPTRFDAFCTEPRVSTDLKEVFEIINKEVLCAPKLTLE